MIEFSNHLVELGHEVDMIMVLDSTPLTCDWMECKANVIHVGDRRDYDIAIFNHAPVWVAMDRIIARLKVYYWLGFEGAYMKSMPWKDAYAQKYFIIANSPWTAKMASMMYGFTPPVILGGLDHTLFHPVEVEKEYDLLCCSPGDRPEKGLDYMERVAQLLGLKLTNFAPKDLPQSELATEYSKARVFIGAPIVEGHYQPGLEAMACGTPVVMSNSGGNTWYARDGENCFLTARNAGDLAYGVKTVLENEEIRNKFIKNGLATVEKLDWLESTKQLEQLLIHELKKTI